MHPSRRKLSPQKMNATTAPRPSGMLCQVLASPSPLEFFDERVTVQRCRWQLEVADPLASLMFYTGLYGHVDVYGCI